MAQDNLHIAKWTQTKYFIKCSCCGYEIIKIGLHTLPRKCPKCDSIMEEGGA